MEYINKSYPGQKHDSATQVAKLNDSIAMAEQFLLHRNRAACRRRDATNHVPRHRMGMQVVVAGNLNAPVAKPDDNYSLLHP